MKKTTHIVAAGAALLAAPLFAQEVPRANQPDPPIQFSGEDADAQAQPAQVQPGQLQPAQPRPLPAQPGARPAQPAQPGERVTAQKPRVEDTQETDFAQHVAACLIIANKAEIAVTEQAMDKIQNPQIRELAQMIVKDHTQFVSKLKEHAPQAANLELDLQGGHARSDASATVRAGEDREANSPADPAHANATAAQRSASETLADKALRVDKKYHEYKVQMLSEELSKHQGQDFEQAFLGAQVAGHMSMLAKLKALETEVQDQEVAQLIKQGQQTTKSHLEEAKQLMNQEKDVETQGAARRGETPRATDRTPEGSTRPAPNRDR